MSRSIILAVLLIVMAYPAVSQQTTKPFRIGIAGLTHGHVHGILSRAHDGDIEIVGIAETNRELAERLLSRYKLPPSILYSSLEEMLVKARPEAVTAFNSTAEHLGVVRACAMRKVHVMVEKPLAINFDQAKQIQQLASKNGIHVLTNYETTWYGSNTTVSDLVSKPQTFGEIRKVVIHDGHEGPIEIGVEKEFLEWLINPEKNGGGALMDFGCYGANQMTWLMKGQRPLSVSATTQQFKPHEYPRVEDEATIVVVYPKAQGIFQASWNWPFGRKDMEVYGEKGYIIADRNGSRIKTSASQPEETVKAAPLSKPFNDPFAYLAAVVRGEVKVSPSDFSSLENNMIVMEILDAATRSAKEKKVITLSP